MKTTFLTALLLFLVFGAVFAFLRRPFSDLINAILIAAGEGREIRVDNTDTLRRKVEKQVKVQGGPHIAYRAEIKVFREQIAAPPVNVLTPERARRSRKNLFIPYWAVLGIFDLSAIQRLDMEKALADKWMNGDLAAVSFQSPPNGLVWRKVQPIIWDGRISLKDMFRKNRKSAAAWAVTDVEVDRDYPDAVILTGIQQYGRIFLNGREIFVSTTNHQTNADVVKLKVNLRKGRNRIVVKCATSNSQTWCIYLRLATSAGVPLLAPAPPEE